MFEDNSSNFEKAKDFKNTLKRLLKYLAKYKIKLIFVILLAVFSTIFMVVGPKILGGVTTEIFNGVILKINNNGGIDFNKIQNTLIFLAILYVVSTSFEIIENFIMTDITQDITYELRYQIFKKINKLPFKYYDEKTHGEVLSLVTNDVEVLSQNLNQTATDVTSSIVTIIGILIVMISISFKMTLIALLIIPISLFLMIFVAVISQKYFKKTQDKTAIVNGHIEQMYSGYTDIKIYNSKDKFISDFDIENKELYSVSLKSQFLSGIMHPMMNFVSNLGYVVTSIFGGYLVVKGKIKVGDIQAFIQYIKQFTRPFADVSEVSSMIQAMVAASERIFDFLDLEEEQENYLEELNQSSVKGSIEFKNVSFSYDGKNNIINNFNLKVKPKEHIAIVGKTGCGKTTLIKLLMRFYDLDSGKILIDGKNINNYKKSDYLDIFGMVLQDTWLFNGSIEDNIKYSSLSSSFEDIVRSSKLAYADNFITKKPDGYNMVINEDMTNISEGEKQLLTIARVILKNPKILILDEATSNVDIRMENLIQKSMDELMKDKTTFIIAHHLSTIKQADRIIVIDKGSIVEVGTHDELLKKNGYYREIYKSGFDK